MGKGSGDITFYPGCAMSGTSAEYADSLSVVCERIGMRLHELEDWNCCGASSAHMTAPEVAVELPKRNLRLAYAHARDILVPCSACFSRLKTAEKDIVAGERGSEMAHKASHTTIYHVNDLFVADGWLAKVAEAVSRPLTGLKVVPYYGCLSVRPPEITDCPDCENPTAMDRILEALGAEVVQWSYKTDCCGGSLTMTRPEHVRVLAGKLFDAAAEAGGACLATACPLCQSNLDTRQGQIEAETGNAYNLPVFFITELMGVAMGHTPTQGWWKKHFVDPRPLLDAKGLTDATATPETTAAGSARLGDNA